MEVGSHGGSQVAPVGFRGPLGVLEHRPWFRGPAEVASLPAPQMYNFTSFTVSLNELETGMEKTLPPTDCRLRPDIRGMENGNMGAFLQSEEGAGAKGALARVGEHKALGGRSQALP